MALHSMKEASKMTGLTYDAIKFYCNKGLIPGVQRDENNYRVFDDKTIAWMQSLSCLKNCGLSVAEMQKYLDFCLEGPSSIEERKAMLMEKREDLLTAMAAMQEALRYIDEKQDFYDGVLSGTIEYQSNLQ